MKTFKTFGILIIASLPILSYAGIVAGPITNAANGHIYYLLTTSSWVASEMEAQTLGGHLATIRSQAENDWVISTFESYGGVHRDLWIGLNDAATEGVQVWASGEVSTWRPVGSQDNTPSGDEDHVHIVRLDVDPRGVWNDYPETGGRPCYGVVEVVSLPPPVLNIRVSHVELCWDARANEWYQLQYRSSLTTNQWTPLVGTWLAGTGAQYCTNDTVQVGQPKRFYRVAFTNAPPQP